MAKAVQCLAGCADGAAALSAGFKNRGRTAFVRHGAAHLRHDLVAGVVADELHLHGRSRCWQCQQRHSSDKDCCAYRHPLRAVLAHPCCLMQNLHEIGCTRTGHSLLQTEPALQQRLFQSGVAKGRCKCKAPTRVSPALSAVRHRLTGAVARSRSYRRSYAQSCVESLENMGRFQGSRD